MRADLIVDVPSDAGGQNKVVDDYYEDKAYDLTTLVREGDPLRDARRRHPWLCRPIRFRNPTSDGAEVQEIVIEGGTKGFLEEAIYKGEKFKPRTLFRKHRKIWTLNGIASHSMVMDPMFTLKLGDSYRWKIKNDTAWDHPMHLHGHHFRILSRQRQARAPSALGRYGAPASGRDRGGSPSSPTIPATGCFTAMSWSTIPGAWGP